MTTGKALNGKPYAGNPHVRFDEGEVASAAMPRRGSLLYRTTSFRHAVALALAAVVVEVSQCHAQCHVCNGECYADETDSAETPPFLHSSERMDSPKKHDGKYSMHEFSLRGRGPAHSAAELARYGMGENPCNGSDISCAWHIEWPEGRSGLSQEALSKVRKGVLSMVFGSEFGGEGEWMPPDDSVFNAKERMRSHAMKLYTCTHKPLDRFHYCSGWSFSAHQHLDWPFGVTASKSGKWYERPVLSVCNYGYSNDRGNGCHSFFFSKIYSLPDGKELGVEDYFAKDKLDALGKFVFKRLMKDNKLSGGDMFEEDCKRDKIDLKAKYVYMFVSSKGVRWTLAPYSLFAGCYGILSVTIEWKDLEPFAAEPHSERR